MSARPDKPQANGARRYDPEMRERSLVLAEHHGASEAARRTGIPAGTIRRWRHETGRSKRPNDVDSNEWARRKSAAASETWDAARQALRRVRELLERGGSRGERDAKDAALTLAILLDKSAALEQASALADERAVRLAEAQGQAIAGALGAICDDLGLPRETAVRKVVAHHIRALTDGLESSPAPTSDAARAAIRGRVRDELIDENQTVSAREKPQLAPSAGTHDRQNRTELDPIAGRRRSSSELESR